MTCMMRGVFVEETGHLGRLDEGLGASPSLFCWAEWENTSSSVESRIPSMEAFCGGDWLDCDVSCVVVWGVE